MRHAGFGRGFVPEGAVEIEMRPLHRACFIPSRPRQEQKRKKVSTVGRSSASDLSTQGISLD